MTTVLRSETDQRKALAGVTIDTICLRFRLDGLLTDDWFGRPILSRWREHRDRSRATWSLAHHDLPSARLYARDMIDDGSGKLVGGILELKLSVSELVGHLRGRTDNVYKAAPQQCYDALFSFVRALEEAWELADGELWDRHVVVRCDVAADVWTDDPQGAVAVVAGRSAMVAKRAAQEGWSFESQKGPHSTLIPRRAREQGRSLRSTEPSVCYDKGRQLGKAGRDLVGLVRFECVTGTGRAGRDRVTISQVCAWSFWIETLRERLLELGLPADVKLEQCADIPTAIGKLVADGVSPAQAALYAVSVLSPGGLSSVPARALRANRRQVETRTNIRFSTAKTSPTFVADLHALISAAPPHDLSSPVLSAKIARLVGERTCPSQGSVDLSYLDTIDVSALTGEHVHDVDAVHTAVNTTTVTETSTMAPPLHAPPPLALGAPPQALGDRDDAPVGEGTGPRSTVQCAQGRDRPRRYKLPRTGAQPQVQGTLSAGGGTGKDERRGQELSQIHTSIRPPDLCDETGSGGPAVPSRPPRRSEGSGETPAPDPIETMLAAICEDWGAS